MYRPVQLVSRPAERALKRVYVEITNICNLRCSFCPGTRREKRYLPPEEFRVLAERLRPYTAYLYLHVMGEPLLHPQLEELLHISWEMGFKICLTTNGVLLPDRQALLLSGPPLHKVSVSLHSMEGNGAGELGGYLSGAWEYAVQAARRGTICALRLWNIGGADRRNGEILDFLAEKLGERPLSLPQPRKGSWKLGERLYLEQAEKFEWPDLARPEGRRQGPGSAWACGTRRRCCATAPWSPAVWTTRGTSLWGIFWSRILRKFWTARGPEPSMTASPRAGPARNCAAGADLPSGLRRRRRVCRSSRKN